MIVGLLRIIRLTEGTLPMFNHQLDSMHRSVLRDTVQSIKRNSLMSLASVLSITAALIILGIFLVLTINIHQATSNIESGLQMQIFMKQEHTEEQKNNLQTELESNNLIAEVKYESKEEALQNFSSSLQSYSGLMSSFNDSNNPMPDSFVVKAKDAQSMEQIKQAIENSKQKDSIEYIKYGEDYVQALTNFNHFVNILCIVVVLVLSVISYFLIYNTIKLTVFARRKEIGIMKYVGATDSYIRTPFILEGAFLGIIAALVATMAIRTGYFYVLGFLGGSALLPISVNLASPSMVVAYIVLFFLAYGILIGTLGSMFAIRKFLDV